MAFQELKIAKGYDNVAGLTNIESIKISTDYFPIMEDLGKWSEGTDVIRGDGVVIQQGYPSTQFYAGAVSLAMWDYIFVTVLGNTRSGKVTFRARTYDAAVYQNLNGILTVPAPLTMKKTNRWYEDVIFSFTRVRRIGGFSSGFSIGFNRYET